MAKIVVYPNDPEVAHYLPRYRGDTSRAMNGVAEDRTWARYIYAHDYNPGWRAWADEILNADPDWINGRNRRCDCREYQHRTSANARY